MFENVTSIGKTGLNTRTYASPKWDRTRCPEDINECLWKEELFTLCFV